MDEVEHNFFFELVVVVDPRRQKVDSMQSLIRDLILGAQCERDTGPVNG